jgi:hypothetical protein
MTEINRIKRQLKKEFLQDILLRVLNAYENSEEGTATVVDDYYNNIILPEHLDCYQHSWLFQAATGQFM